jgi:diguanylate cyclase (GGDEF)-like protein/PAS domain S-box-containing protein
MVEAATATRELDGLKSAPVAYGVIAVDGDHRIVFFDSWIERRSGIAAASTVGRSLRQIFPQAGIGRLERAITAALEQGLSSTLSYPFHGPILPLYEDPGAAEPVRIGHNILIKPLTTDAARLCLVQVTDVSEAVRQDSFLKSQCDAYRRMAEDFQASEAQARAIIDKMAEALLVLDANGRILDINGATERLFGRGIEVLRGRDYRNLLDIADPTFARQGGAATSDATGLDADGRRFPAAIALSTVDIDGRQRQILTIRDQTERKGIEDAIHREKEFAQVTLQSITDAVLTTDSEGRVNFLNPAACNLLELDPERALGQPLLQLIDFDRPEANASANRVLRATLYKGKRDRLGNETVLVVPGKGTIAVDTHLTPLRDIAGRIIGTVMVLQDVSQERRLQEQLTHQATHDELTGLINRREFQRRLDELLTRTTQDSISSVLLFLDLDQFKIVNDTCGHKAGDELLRQISHALLATIRNTDTLARLGGDEFAILLPGCSQVSGERIAKEVLEAIESFRFSWANRTFAVGASIGLVCIDTHNCTDSKVLMSAADAACYLAKDQGRNRVVVYDREGETLEQQRGERLWASRIQEAIAGDRFSLFYQPIMHCQGAGAASVGCELLIRWIDDDGQPTLPMAFIPTAERYNLMTPVDSWVIRSLTKLARTHRDRLMSFDWIGVNVSGLSLTNEAFLDFVIEHFEASGLPWSKICFEITETAAVSNLVKARRFIDPLREKGCRFALDDFGSGFSSFPYLKNFPVDFVKIDGMFVKGMTRDPVDAAIVRSICDIAKAMNLKTIGESVENHEWLPILEESGLDYGQGYGIARPRPLADFVALSHEEFTASLPMPSGRISAAKGRRRFRS